VVEGRVERGKNKRKHAWSYISEPLAMHTTTLECVRFFTFRRGVFTASRTCRPSRSTSHALDRTARHAVT